MRTTLYTEDVTVFSGKFSFGDVASRGFLNVGIFVVNLAAIMGSKSIVSNTDDRSNVRNKVSCLKRYLGNHRVTEITA